MGGGGSSSTNNTYNQIDVKPETTLNFNLDELAAAIRDGNLSEAEAEEAKRKIALAQLQIQDRSNNIEAKKNDLTADFNIITQNLADRENALELRKQISTENIIINLTEEVKAALKVGTVGVVGYLIYKEMKKGKK